MDKNNNNNNSAPPAISKQTKARNSQNLAMKVDEEGFTDQQLQ